MSEIIEMNKLTLYDLLTVDTHGETIAIQDSAGIKSYNLIGSRRDFFRNDGLFSKVENDGIKIIKHNEKKAINLNKFLQHLDTKKLHL